MVVPQTTCRVSGRINRGSRPAVAVFAQDFDETLPIALRRCCVQAHYDFGQMHGFGRFLAGAELAVEVPVIHTGRQGHAALAFEVFSKLVFDGVQHAVRVFAFDLKFERFSHGSL